MAIYYFHICNGTGFTVDEEGVDLSDIEAARAKAVESARGVMMGDLRQGLLDLTSFIEVEDESRKLLFTLTFGEAVDVKAEHTHHQRKRPG